MGNLFVVYGDVLSERLLFLADVLAVPAYAGLMAPQDELTHQLFNSVNGLCLQKAIEDKYGEERMARCGIISSIHINWSQKRASTI